MAPRAGVYGNRGHGDGIHGDGMYADGTDGGRRRRGVRGGRRAAAVIALILGLAGFAVSAFGVAIQLLPRHFTASQQRQIEAWEVMRRWQTMPAGQIFPASVSYQLPAKVLQDTVPLNLDALRVSIAPAGIGLRQGRDQRVGRRGAAQERVRGGAQGDLRRRHPELRDDRRRRRAAERGRRRQRGQRD